jgi:hypothetical protein
MKLAILTLLVTLASSKLTKFYKENRYYYSYHPYRASRSIETENNKTQMSTITFQGGLNKF